jgi:tetratricopeptide (TPR) repeat protein
VSAALGEPPAVDRTDPEVVEAQLSIAVSWWDSGAREPALELLELVVRANPEQAEGLATLAEYRFEVGRVDDGEALARRSLAADPTNAAALFVLGLVHDARGDTAGAAGWFDRLRALPIEPEDRDWMALSLAEKDLTDRYPL